MKKLMLFIVISGFLNFVVADVWVNGYTKSNGTYVEGHYRSSPNDTKSDNWSTYGNTNPYTGEEGTKRYDDYNNYGQNSNSQNYTYDDYERDGGDAQYSYSRPTNTFTKDNEKEESIWMFVFFGFLILGITFGMYSFIIGGIYKLFTKKEYELSSLELYLIYGVTIILTLMLYFG